MKNNKLFNVSILILVIISILLPIANFAFGWLSDMNPRESIWFFALLASFLILIISSIVFIVIGIYALIKKRIWKGFIILVLSISLFPALQLYKGKSRAATNKHRLELLHSIGPGKLRDEAKILISKYTKSEDDYIHEYVPENEWPSSMKTFNPAVIVVNNDRIYLYYGKFVNAGRGLCIFPPNVNIEPESHYRHPFTKLYDGVYFFMSGN